MGNSEKTFLGIVVFVILFFTILATNAFGYFTQVHCNYMSELHPMYEWRRIGLNYCYVMAPWGEWIVSEDFEWVEKFEEIKETEDLIFD